MSRAVPLPPMAPSLPAQHLLLGGAALMAALTHVALLGVLLQAGAVLLAMANLGSVLIYLLVWFLVRLGVGRRWAQPLVGAETLANAVLAVLLLGWNSEFAACLAALLAVMAAFTISRQRKRLLTVFLVVGLYGSLALLNDSRSAAADANNAPLAYGLHLFNLVCLVFLPAASGGLYQRLITKAWLWLSQWRSIDRASGLANQAHTLALLRHQLEASGHAPGGLDHAAAQPLTAVLAQVSLIGVPEGPMPAVAAKSIAHRLRKGLRLQDSLGRWGEHEFLAVLPGADAGAARIASERLKAQIRALHFRLPGVETVCAVSVRLGVASAQAGDDAEDLIERCELALRAERAASRRRRQVAAKLAAASSSSAAAAKSGAGPDGHRA